MSEAMFTNAIVSLFEVAEVNSIGGVPLDVGVEALMLVNPDVEPQQAHAIATQLDSRGRQVLSKDDFIEAVRFVLTDVDSSEAVHMINDLVMRMRMTYRRRYLMYDAPANRCAPALLQNVRTVEMYREMFDIFAHGQEYISRHDLRRLANEILPEYPTDAANIVKAAIGEGERDAIGFQEFIMVIQPTTSRRPLSEMIQLATSRIMNWSSDDGDRGYNPSTSAVGGGGTPHKGTARNADDGSNTAFGSPMLTSSLQPWRESEDLLAQNAGGGGGGGGGGNRSRATTPPPSGNAVGQRPRHGGGATSSSYVISSPTGAGTLHHELQQAKQHHEAAEAIFQNVLTGNQRVNLATITKLSDVGATMKMPSLLERDLAQMKLENETLKHQVAQLQMSNLRLGSGRSGGSPRRNGGGAAGGIGANNQDAMAHIAELEHELRSARAQLAVRTEAHQLIALLNKSNTTEEGLRQYYHDERTLISKQEYLRSVSSTLHEGDGTSPISLVLSQYDLIVCGYQALFRDLKRRYDAGGGGGRFGGSAVGGRPRHYDNSSAASTIVPKNVPVKYSVPSRGTSPSRTLAAPLRWQELDAEVSTDMKGTGTLRDPLLTLEERNQLRAKLASQMRGAARHYTPKKKQQNPYAATAQEYAASNIHGGGGGAYDHDEAPANHDEHAQLQQWLMPGAATQLASHDAVSRLHSLQHQAVKQRRL